MTQKSEKKSHDKWIIFCRGFIFKQRRGKTMEILEKRVKKCQFFPLRAKLRPRTDDGYRVAFLASTIFVLLASDHRQTMMKIMKIFIKSKLSEYQMKISVRGKFSCFVSICVTALRSVKWPEEEKSIKSSDNLIMLDCKTKSPCGKQKIVELLNIYDGFEESFLNSQQLEVI